MRGVTSGGPLQARSRYGLGSMSGDSTGQQVVGRVERLLELAERRVALLSLDPGTPGSEPSSSSAPGARDRARELLEHTRSYLLPRARNLDAPLVVVLLGSTGAGKSTLLNTIAGAVVSRAGVLRPTTHHAVVLATARDGATLLERGPMAALPAARVEVASHGARSGVVVVDAPDLDSIATGNRVLSDSLLELADLCVFVTTATRYADRVPWDVLARIEERGLPLIVVVNRLPPWTRRGGRPGPRPPPRRRHASHRHRSRRRARPAHPIQVLGVPEGALDAARQSLAPGQVVPMLQVIDGLAADRGKRRALAEQALAGALAGLAPLTNAIAGDLELVAGEADRLIACTHGRLRGGDEAAAGTAQPGQRPARGGRSASGTASSAPTR